MKLKKNDAEMVKVSVQMSKCDWEKIKKHCKKNDMFIGAYITQASLMMMDTDTVELEKYIEQQEQA